MGHQRLTKHLQLYRGQLLSRAREGYSGISQRLIDFELSEAGALSQKSDWTHELDGLVKGYNAKKDDLRNCFRLIDAAKQLHPKQLERDFLDELSNFQQNLEHNVAEQLDTLRLEEADVAEVERLASLTITNGSSYDTNSGPIMGRPRKKSMLPTRGKGDSFMLNPRKSIDMAAPAIHNPRVDRLSPGKSPRPFGNKSKSPSHNPQQYSSANVHQNFAVPADTTYNRGFNTSNILGGLRADIFLGETLPLDGSTERQTVRAGLNNQKTPGKSSGMLGRPTETSPPHGATGKHDLDEEDGNLLASGLFDNGSKNKPALLRGDRSKPTLPPANPTQYVSNPATAVHSFYQGDGKDQSIHIGSVRDAGVPNRFHTPHKSPSQAKLGGTREKTPERRTSRIDPDVSRISVNVLPSGGLANRNVTPSKSVRNKTPEKAPKAKPFFETEPLKTLMRTLESDSLNTFTLRNANLTDDLVADICDRIQYKNNLRVLDLSYNNITDVGLARICDALPRTQVTNLILDFNKVTNEGLKTCFSLVRNPNNKVFNISLYPCLIEKTTEGRRQIIEVFQKKGVTLKF